MDFLGDSVACVRFSNTEFSSMTLNELTMKARESTNKMTNCIGKLNIVYQLSGFSKIDAYLHTISVLLK